MKTAILAVLAALTLTACTPGYRYEPAPRSQYSALHRPTTVLCTWVTYDIVSCGSIGFRGYYYDLKRRSRWDDHFRMQFVNRRPPGENVLQTPNFKEAPTRPSKAQEQTRPTSRPTQRPERSTIPTRAPRPIIRPSTPRAMPIQPRRTESPPVRVVPERRPTAKTPPVRRGGGG